MHVMSSKENKASKKNQISNLEKSARFLLRYFIFHKIIKIFDQGVKVANNLGSLDF